MKISLSRWLELRRKPWRRQVYDSYRRWRRDGMEARRWDIRDIGPGDVVLDFGGFAGDWAALARRRWGARVHVFEPHPEFAARLEARFADDPEVLVHPVALGQAEGVLKLSDSGDASSAVSGAPATVEGRVAKAGPYLDSLGIEHVALAKINIEGGEYDLLPALLDSGWARRIERFQIQFHLYAEEDQARREAIRDRLGETHVADWEYPFIWEAWSRRPSPTT